MKKLIINLFSFICIIGICFSVSDKQMLAYAESVKWDLEYGPDTEFSIDTTQKSGDGKYSIKIKNNDYSTSRIEKTFKVKPNTMYRATVMAKCTSYSESKDPAHTQYNKFGAVLATAQHLPNGSSYTGGTWKKLTYCFNSGADEEYTLALYNSANKGTVYFSDFKLEEITEDSNKWNLCVVYLKNIEAPYVKNDEEKIYSATFCEEDIDFCTETINKLYSFMNLLTDGRMDIKSIDFYECDETVQSLIASGSGNYSINNNDKAISEKLNTIITEAEKNSGKRYDQFILVSPVSTDISGKLGSNYLYSDIIQVYINHLEMRNTLIATFVHEILHSVEHVSMQIDPDHTAELHAVDGEYSEYYRVGQNGLPGNCAWFSDYSRRTTHDGRGLHENAFYKHGKTIYANGKVASDSEKITYEKTDIGTLEIDKISDKVYTGEEIKPAITVKDGDTTLKCGTDYNLTYSCNTDIGIASVIIEGLSKYSGTVKQNFNIIPEKTEVSATLSGSDYNLSWKASKGATGYEIYGLADGKEFSLLKTIEVNSTDTVLNTTIASDGKQYEFKIRTYKKVYPQTFYSEDYAPAPVDDFALGGRASNALRLNWAKNDTADGYIIEIYKNNEWTTAVKITNPDTTTCNVTGLMGGTYYSLRMKAYKTYGETVLYSKYTSDISSCTTPAKITGLKLGGRASDALRLNWTKNDKADGYTIEQYKSGKWIQIAKIEDSAITTYRVSGLAAGTVYKFRMRAYKTSVATDIYSSYTSTLSIRTNPSKVTGLKLGGRASNALRLNWTENTSADGYIIEQYKSGKWVRIKKITTNATTTYRISGLTPSTQYKFRIKTYKMSGTTALYSGYISLSAYTNPSNVANLKITGKARTALRIGWSKNTSADGYIVEMYSGSKWVRVAKITSNATVTYRKSGLKKGTTYKFRVRTYNIVGKTALYGGYVNITGTTNK